MRKIIERGLCIISCLFLLWLFVSWAEVVSKNLKPNPTYSSWNAWVLKNWAACSLSPDGTFSGRVCTD